MLGDFFDVSLLLAESVSFACLNALSNLSFPGVTYGNRYIIGVFLDVI